MAFDQVTQSQTHYHALKWSIYRYNTSFNALYTVALRATYVRTARARWRWVAGQLGSWVGDTFALTQEPPLILLRRDVTSRRRNSGSPVYSC